MAHRPRMWLFSAAVLIAGSILWLGVRLATRVELKPYDLTGRIVAVHPETTTVTVHNEDMPGLMAPMDMDYQMKDTAALSILRPGDRIHGRLLTDRQSVWELENVSVVESR